MKKLVKFNNHIYYLPNRKAGDRPYLFYIKGTKYSIAIDAGNCKDHLDYFYNELKRNNLALPKYTIISHWHWDHTFALPYINGTSICSTLTNKKLKEISKWPWTFEDMMQREKDGLDVRFTRVNILYEYKNLKDIKVVTCDKAIRKNMTLDLGDLKVELIPFVSTHSDDSLFVYLKDEALFVQDADWIDPYISYEYDQVKLKNMLKFFEGLNYKYHFLGHVPMETKEFALNRLKKEVKQ